MVEENEKKAWTRKLPSGFTTWFA